MATLTQIRKQRKLSQMALASAAGVTQATLSTMERGFGCRKDTFFDVCEALGVSPEEIEGVNLRARVGRRGWTGVRHISLTGEEG